MSARDDIKVVSDQEPVIHVDATPDAGYPLRILQAYRQRAAACRMVVTGGNKNLQKLADGMNEAAAKRIKVLDKAIALLSGKVPETKGEG